MDILPSDLATDGEDAKKLLNKLQTRNERLFMLTFLVLNVADTKQKLGNDVFQAAGVAQKYNCSLVRLDYQQEQGLVSSLPLGINQIKIQRSLTTSNVAVFVPFVTQELFQSGAAMYYGINAKSHNMIMLDRKQAPVSYTHLDVYKRQFLSIPQTPCLWTRTRQRHRRRNGQEAERKRPIKSTGT